MGNNSIIQILLVVLVLLCLATVYIFIQYSKLHKANTQDSIFISSKKRTNNWYPLYKFFSNFALTRKYLNRIRLQYDILIPGDQKSARESAIKMAITIWGISGLVVILSLFTGLSVYVYMCVYLFIYVFSDQIVRITVEKKDTRILVSFSKFLSDVRHQYFMHGMIDESIYESLDKTDKVMQLHAQKMYDILTDDDVEGELQKYNDTVPNQFLKTFMALCVTLIKYGDKKVHNQSLFLTSIKNLKQEIEIEILKRQSINHRFGGLIGIAVAPFFFLGAIQSWATGNMPELENYYRGTVGTVLTILIFVSTIICYNLVNKLKENNHIDMKDYVILRKIADSKPMHLLIDGYCSRNYGKMQNMQDLLKRVGDSITSREFFVKRLLYGFVTFVIVVGVAFTMHANSKHLTINDVSSMSSTTTGATEKDAFIMMLYTWIYVNEFKDSDLVDEYNQTLKSGFTPSTKVDNDVKAYWKDYFENEFNTRRMEIPDELAMKIAGQYTKVRETSKLNLKVLVDNGITDLHKQYPDDTVNAVISGLVNIVEAAKEPKALSQQMLMDSTADEIISRITKYQKQYFHWYELVLAVILAIAAYWEPYLMILYRKKILQMSMEDEVIQFQSIIMMLMYIDRMTIDSILEWMLQFANIFHTSIQECINNLPMGEDDALDKLIEDEPFEQFKRIVENIKMCDRIGILSAFNEIESERMNYQEKRKQENEIYVSKKSAIGRMMSFLPMGEVIALYLIGVFCWESVRQLMVYMKEMVSMQNGM